MKVFIYESENELGQVFQVPEFHIPFLSSSLLKHLGSMIVRSSIALGEDYQIFLPNTWESLIDNPNRFNYYSGDVHNRLMEHQKAEYELVFITNLYSVFLLDLLPEDISYLKQNPEKLFSSRGVLGGYLRRGQELPVPESFDGFRNTIELNKANYLRINQDLVSNISLKSKETAARVYGKPVVLSENVTGDSTICGPSFIGENVHISNSYIAPGTVISGNCFIQDSEIFGSVIHESTIINTSIKDSIVSETKLEHVNSIAGSTLPAGSVIIGERKI